MKNGPSPTEKIITLPAEKLLRIYARDESAYFYPQEEIISVPKRQPRRYGRCNVCRFEIFKVTSLWEHEEQQLDMNHQQ